MGDCKDESKSECCQTKSCCDSGHKEAHAWMASRISHLEKRANCTCRWLAFVTVVLLCIGSFFVGRCCGMKCGKGGGPQCGSGPACGGGPGPGGGCGSGPACGGGLGSTSACSIGVACPPSGSWQCAPGGPQAGCIQVEGVPLGGACGSGPQTFDFQMSGPGGPGSPGSPGSPGMQRKVEVRWKAIVIGPDGQRREINLDGGGDVDVGAIIKRFGPGGDDDDAPPPPAPPAPPKP